MKKAMLFDAVGMIDTDILDSYTLMDQRLRSRRVRGKNKRYMVALLAAALAVILSFALLTTSLPLIYITNAEKINPALSETVDKLLFPLDQGTDGDEITEEDLLLNWGEWKLAEDFFAALGAGTADSVIDKMQNMSNEGIAGESLQNLGDFLARLYEYYQKHYKQEQEQAPEKEPSETIEIEYEGCTYQADSNLTYWTLMRVDQLEDGILEIPEQIDGIPVRYIHANAALENIYIKELRMPDSIIKIGDQAFCNCQFLESVVWSSSLKEIGAYAFHGCIGLRRVTLPNSLTELGEYAFSNCSTPEGDGLEYVHLSRGLTDIPRYCFKGTFSLRQVVIPDSVTSIRRGAFEDCDSLTEISLPDDLSYIAPYAFKSSGLVSVTIPEAITELLSGVFENCYALKKVTLPKGLTKIGDTAFQNCGSLTSIEIPNSVTEIGTSAFQNCTSLINPHLPDSVTIIGESAFKGCTSLGLTKLPESVTQIGSAAFQGCTGLQSIVMPDALTAIERDTFRDCTALRDVQLPEHLERVEDYAFDNTAIKQIRLPISVTNLQDSAFSTVEYVEIDCSIFNWYVRVTENYSNGCVFSELAKVKCIDGEYFANSTPEIEYIQTGENNTYKISGYLTPNIAYAYVNPYVEGQPVVSLDRAFKADFYLIRIYLSDSIEALAESEFESCPRLEYIALPQTLTEIPANCFLNTTSLESIEIPVSVKTIKGNAFGGTSALKTVQYQGTVQQWQQIELAKDAFLAGVTIVCTDGEIVID